MTSRCKLKKKSCDIYKLQKPKTGDKKIKVKLSPMRFQIGRAPNQSGRRTETSTPKKHVEATLAPKEDAKSLDHKWQNLRVA